MRYERTWTYVHRAAAFGRRCEVAPAERTPTFVRPERGGYPPKGGQKMVRRHLVRRGTERTRRSLQLPALRTPDPSTRDGPIHCRERRAPGYLRRERPPWSSGSCSVTATRGTRWHAIQGHDVTVLADNLPPISSTVSMALSRSRSRRTSRLPSRLTFAASTAAIASVTTSVDTAASVAHRLMVRTGMPVRRPASRGRAPGTALEHWPLPRRCTTRFPSGPSLGSMPRLARRSESQKELVAR